ncbi:integral membrane protein [Aureobasidium pullulans]|uniref:Integral membrane protein n=1 Tax=Aureobasidium pullulans TaxID=5580 RepID=A0A4S8VZ41_AURPU|nr:integral membrane protein [Aureobasidium pullulans]THX42713.1 integral membrane protein [Aureobasidium pullulans]
MPDSQGRMITTVSVVFAVLSVFVMILRLFARIVILGKMGLDDILICIAALLAWAFAVATIIAVHHGLGQHMDEVMKKGTANLNTYSQTVWLSSIFYNACLGFLKSSILAFYLRLGDPQLKRLAQILLAIVICQAIANVFTCIFQCTPVAAAYTSELQKTSKCVNISAFYLTNATLTILTDLLTYILPFHLVRKLQIPRRQKIGLGVMLGLGLFTCMSSIIRITYIPNMLFSKDQTWTISGPMYWSVIETNVGILTASMPAFKAIAKKYAPKLLGGSYDSNRYPSRSVHIRAGSSGFHKMGGTGGSNHMALDTIDRDLGMSKGRFQTTINQDTDSVSSSEEALHPPDRIGVTRQVHVEGESRSVFEERNSLSSHKDHRELS